MAIFLGLLAGVGWASAIVATRIVIKKTEIPDELGALYSIFVAGLIAFLLAALTSADFRFEWSIISGIIAVGVVSPGFSQLTYYTAIRSIGASRAGVFIGTAPVFTVLGAYFFSDGDLNLAIGLGTLTVVLGSALLSTEKSTEHLKILGVAAGLLTSFLFGARDVISSEILTEENLNSAFTAGLLWLSGVPIILLYAILKRSFFSGGKTPATTEEAEKVENVKKAEKAVFFKKSYFLVAIPGVIQGLALSSMLEGFKRGRVEIIAPVSNSVASIGAVVLAYFLLGQGELNKKIIVSMLLVVVGAIVVSSLG